MADFETFITEAHRRGLRVIADLVVNHTSDQHPWFQSARSAPDSPYRDYYVWSDTDQRYRDARIIFVDTEKSNWTWDPDAKAYYWHRFFSHQPDLNYDNPAVQTRHARRMRFWLDKGLDGFRCDAVPYLFEREGTNCENLPETHAFLKRLRGQPGRAVPRADPPGRGQPVAARRPPLLRRRRRVPHGLPFPADAAHVPGRPSAGTAGPSRTCSCTPRPSPRTASGASSSGTTTS